VSDLRTAASVYVNAVKELQLMGKGAT
jgi:hypothetical protein